MYEDGSMDISVEITNDMEIMPLVKYWMPHIQILKPKRINDLILSDLEQYIKVAKESL